MIRKYVLPIVALAIVPVRLVAGAIVIENATLLHESSDGIYYDGPLDNAPYGQTATLGDVSWSGLASPIRYAASLGNYDQMIDMSDCFTPDNCTYESGQQTEYHDADAAFRLRSAGVLQVVPDPQGDLGLRISNAQTGTVLHDAAMNTLSASILLPPGTWNFVVDDINAGVSTSESNNYYDEETGSYDYSSYSSYDTSGWVEIAETVLAGPVVTIGDVDPGGTAVQPNPWSMHSKLDVGKAGHGTLEISAGGAVSNLTGYIGTNPNARGEATVSGIDAEWENISQLYVGYYGDGKLNVTNGGTVTSRGAYISHMSGSSSVITVSGADSVWDSSTSIYMSFKGTGSLLIEEGGTVSNHNSYIGMHTTAVGSVTVTGNDSRWINLGNLSVGAEGGATLQIENGAEVTVAGTTTVGAAGAVHLTGGRFEFGETSLAEFSSIQATGGALAGNVLLGGVNDVVRLTALKNSAADLNSVVADNRGLLHGSATLASSLNNRVDGELRLLAGDWMRFEGAGNLNSGEVHNFGGMLEFSQELVNHSGGFIAGRGQFMADGGWTNRGVMAFSGTTDVLGDVINDTGGQIITAGGATTTIFDDLEHNGAEIRTSADSRTVIFGQASGAGAYTGVGTVFFEGDLRPGNSPGNVRFAGNVVLGTGSTTQIELGGLSAGTQHDQLTITGNTNLDGTLTLVPLEPYTDPDARGAADDFLILTAGERSGTFHTVQYDRSTLVVDFGPDSDGSFRSHVGSGLFRNISYGETSVQFQNLFAAKGDVDGDRDVDITDFNILATSFDPDGDASPPAWTKGNFDDDHDVDITDFNQLATNFTPGGYAVSVVPEPSCCFLLLFALVLFVHREKTLR